MSDQDRRDADLTEEWGRIQEERERFLQERQRIDSFWDALARLGVFVKDFDRGEDRPNHYWREWGFDAEEMRFNAWLDKLHPKDRERVKRELEDVSSGMDNRYTLEYRVLPRDGSPRDVITKGVIVSRFQDGAPRTIIAVDFDVTSLRDAERRVAEARREAQQRAEEAETLRTIGAVIASSLDLEHSTGLVLEQIRHVVAYERATVQLFQLDGEGEQAEGESSTLEVVGLQYAGESGETSQIRDHVLFKAGQPQYSVITEGKPVLVQDMERDYPSYFVSQKRLTHSWLGVPLSVKGRIIGLLAMEAQEPDFFTIQHLRLAMSLVDYIAVAIQNARTYSQAQEEALTDPLTGLRTRRWFFQHGEQLIHQARRYHTPTAFLISDIDHFKKINDEHGHLVGDRVLRSLSLVFLQEMRRADIICRYGGEEFAVLLPHTDLDSALAIAERLRVRAGEVTVERTGEPLSVSIGVATLQDSEATDLRDLIAIADEAMYRAKHEGRNRVCQAS